MDGSRNGWRGKKNLGRKIISFDLWRIPNLHNFILTIVKIAFRESFYFLLNGRFVLNDERDEIRVLSILITIAEKETGRYVDSNEVKKEKKEKKVDGRGETWKRRRARSLYDRIVRHTSVPPLVQEGSTTIMAVPPKGSLLGNEATKLRSPRYLFLALPAQTTPTFFPSIFPPFPTERPPLVSTAVSSRVRGTKSANYFSNLVFFHRREKMPTFGN